MTSQSKKLDHIKEEGKEQTLNTNFDFPLPLCIFSIMTEPDSPSASGDQVIDWTALVGSVIWFPKNSVAVVALAIGGCKAKEDFREREPVAVILFALRYFAHIWCNILRHERLSAEPLARKLVFRPRFWGFDSASGARAPVRFSN